LPRLTLTGTWPSATNTWSAHSGPVFGYRDALAAPDDEVDFAAYTTGRFKCRKGDCTVTYRKVGRWTFTTVWQYDVLTTAN
jgi:hypothetical protein